MVTQDKQEITEKKKKINYSWFSLPHQGIAHTGLVGSHSPRRERSSRLQEVAISQATLSSLAVSPHDRPVRSKSRKYFFNSRRKTFIVGDLHAMRIMLSGNWVRTN